jgi:(p)ppGpp synthase/HD superfamily hydrolase
MTEAEEDAARGLHEASGVLVGAYRGVAVKPGKGVPHARAVASALRRAGCSADVQLAGLLHDVVEDTGWSVGDVRARFGRPVAALVVAVTEDDAIVAYRPRKRALREQIARAGADAIDIALADKVATLGYVLSSGGKLAKRKRAHYEAVAALGGQAAHPALAAQVRELLATVDGRDRPPAAGART